MPDGFDSFEQSDSLPLSSRPGWGPWDADLARRVRSAISDRVYDPRMQGTSAEELIDALTEGAMRAIEWPMPEPREPNCPS